MRVIFDKVKNVKEIELKKEPKEILELKITITEMKKITREVQQQI